MDYKQFKAELNELASKAEEANISFMAIATQEEGDGRHTGCCISGRGMDLAATLARIMERNDSVKRIVRTAVFTHRAAEGDLFGVLEDLIKEENSKQAKEPAKDEKGS